MLSLPLSTLDVAFAAAALSCATFTAFGVGFACGDVGHFVAAVVQSVFGQADRFACFAVAQNFGKPNGNRANECKHTDGQGNDFDVVALDEGELLGSTLEKDGGCAQYWADDGGKPK